jgi:hypothetical protein
MVAFPTLPLQATEDVEFGVAHLECRQMLRVYDWRTRHFLLMGRVRNDPMQTIELGSDLAAALKTRSSRALLLVPSRWEVGSRRLHVLSPLWPHELQTAFAGAFRVLVVTSLLGQWGHLQQFLVPHRHGQSGTQLRPRAGAPEAYAIDLGERIFGRCE